jgi:hypothetical protein
MATTKVTPAPLTRPLSEIAVEIAADWPRATEPGVPTDFGFGTINVGEHPAHPYLVAMRSLRTTDLSGSYYQDPVVHVVRYFVENASSWRGEVAQRVKAELRSAVADYDAYRTGYRPRAHRS